MSFTYGKAEGTDSFPLGLPLTHMEPFSWNQSISPFTWGSIALLRDVLLVPAFWPQLCLVIQWNIYTALPETVIGFRWRSNSKGKVGFTQPWVYLTLRQDREQARTVAAQGRPLTPQSFYIWGICVVMRGRLSEKEPLQPRDDNSWMVLSLFIPCKLWPFSLIQGQMTSLILTI